MTMPKALIMTDEKVWNWLINHGGHSATIVPRVDRDLEHFGIISRVHVETVTLSCDTCDDAIDLKQ